MQLNKVLKGLVIALPVLTLAACSSTRDTSDVKTDSETTTKTEQVVDTSQDSGVEVGTVTSDDTALKGSETANELDALRRQHIVYFDFDKSSVRSEFAEILNAHAAFLVKNPSVKVLVEGHADERGTPEYNIALGERRAKAVSKYLKTLGVLDGQISVVSYGEEKPMVKGHTEDAFSKNRRAVLVY
ncbi:peptidoglycan-associated lipoprotein Pal [Algicola sagamiensis]|uniref:peptidoglycan-associated lipoprotein Pal n=1 Tax=Algicola sagamiensis TaxID=163869 RepID=UPI000369D833|nr:peptidoglycan-associated lipoprotein Pal [Algicola sagamiensis]